VDPLPSISLGEMYTLCALLMVGMLVQRIDATSYQADVGIHVSDAELPETPSIQEVNERENPFLGNRRKAPLADALDISESPAIPFSQQFEQPEQQNGLVLRDGTSNSALDNVVNIFDKWGPDWRIEWTFHIVNLLGPDDPKRPAEQRPWEGYENKCHPAPSNKQSSKCPKSWYNLWHFSKLGSPSPNLDREPAAFLHWNGAGWLMRVDLTEPHLIDTMDHNSWDIPHFGIKPVGTEYNITFEQVMDEAKPGPNATTSKFKIWLDGVDQKVDMPSRYIPRADMQMYWSDPWYKPAGEAVVKTDEFRVWYSKSTEPRQ